MVLIFFLPLNCDLSTYEILKNKSWAVERITYLYNAFGNRAHSFYGNAEAEKEKRPIHKYYSADGSVEIKEDKTKGSIDFLFYLGGDPYSAPAVYNSNGEEGKLLFLHRDQLGSIIAITDLNGKLVEARHFDAWGKVLSITDGNGNTLDKLTLLDRGFTGHEHLQTVGLIHMNGRLYDPALHRFLQPDNYVQAPLIVNNMELTDKLIALLKKGTPVYGTIQKSFSKNDALEILEECLKSRIAILGGDVVNINNNGYFEYNYDNWSYNRKKGESDVDYVLRSIEKAIKYISNYKLNNVYFCISFDIKDSNTNKYFFFKDITL